MRTFFFNQQLFFIEISGSARREAGKRQVVVPRRGRQLSPSSLYTRVQSVREKILIRRRAFRVGVPRDLVRTAAVGLVSTIYLAGCKMLKTTR
ncbi:protein E6B [Proboscivirus elephantidbeta4]|uniref:Protein E6B n=1 Tax=Elephant endotheliotropic herpesvirus 4 TaxID=548914 RepID=A0A0S1TPF8_9BETA|nr:protein E6B [Elephant endotheliotropic herpesvirus 4]ALM25935.1 protein E6B [Elephant endotheliotropic herpesvirus 4]